jgi:hypothetical protein
MQIANLLRELPTTSQRSGVGSWEVLTAVRWPDSQSISYSAFGSFMSLMTALIANPTAHHQLALMK